MKMLPPPHHEEIGPDGEAISAGDVFGISDTVRNRVLSARSMAIWPVDEDPVSESYRIGRYFQDKGWRIYPIHDRCDRLLEETCYRDIRLIPDDYDILLLFTPPEQLPEAVNAIFNADFVPPIVWTPPGVFDQQSFDRLTEAGVLTVMDKDIVSVYKSWLKE